LIEIGRQAFIYKFKGFVLNASTKIQVTNEIDAIFKQLFPICRSITGNGVRETMTYELVMFSPIFMKYIYEDEL